ACQDFVAGGDLDLDGDARVAAAEAAEGVGEQVDARRGRGAEVDGAGLEAGERAEFLLGGPEAGERLGRTPREDTSRVGQAAAAPGPLDQPLAGGRLEQAQVLAGARLADPDRGRCGGDAALPLDLDEQAHPGR